MSLALTSIPFVFPLEPFEAPYLKSKRAKKRCEISYQVLQKNDYSGFLEIFNVD